MEKERKLSANKIIIRKNILPKSFTDFGSITFILIIVPLIYWFELWIVLPELYEYGTNLYIIHFIIGNYLMLNIVANYTFTVLTDTSTRRDILLPKIEDNWRLCSYCETLSPPRSWHCQICNTCILKRDHHCIFTGCCIGHYNHRYFIMFITHLFISTIYAFVFNNLFIWQRITFEFPLSIIKVIFPLAIFLFGFDGSIEQFYLLIYIVNFIGMLFAAVLCFYHYDMILKGIVSYENSKNLYDYDIGFKNNIIEVLGYNWIAALFNPYVKSILPHDGIDWNDFTTIRKNNTKNR